jgi:rare lipoprotein A
MSAAWWGAWLPWACWRLAGCGLSSKPKPVEPAPGATQKGIASWYGPGFHGRRTASGEVYNQFDLTAAHQTLPHGTRVRVINLTNDRTVLVRINDRGPFVDDRIIDLSYAAARQIDMIGPGTAPVRLEIVGPEWSDPVQVAEAVLPARTEVPPQPPERPAPPIPAAPPPQPATSAPVPVPRRAEVVATAPRAARYSVQVAAFDDYQRARLTQQRLESQGARPHLGMVEEGGLRYYRLRLGPFDRQDDAARTVQRINALGYPALIVADRAVAQ